MTHILIEYTFSTSIIIAAFTMLCPNIQVGKNTINLLCIFIELLKICRLKYPQVFLKLFKLAYETFNKDAAKMALEKLQVNPHLLSTGSIKGKALRDF